MYKNTVLWLFDSAGVAEPTMSERIYKFYNPITVIGVLAMFTFQLDNLIGKHCWQPIAIMGDVDTLGPCVTKLLDKILVECTIVYFVLRHECDVCAVISACFRESLSPKNLVVS